MKNFSTNFLLLGAAGILLAACGGSSGNSPAGPSGPVVLAVTPDAVNAAWNEPGTIDVLANDSASRGSLTLAAVSGATHGSAAVANGKISYTPAPGFYGIDKLQYTVRGEGGVSASAQAVITVDAVLTLNGTAGGQPLANATVNATVGNRTFSTTTRADGSYGLTVRSAQPRDFLTLTAQGGAAQSHIKLSSLVGEVDSLARIAGAHGSVDSLAVPSLALTPLSTAAAGMALAAMDGKAPASAAQWRQARSLYTAFQVLGSATAIGMVAEQAVPLPAGPADMLALSQDLTAAEKLVDAQPALAAAVRAAIQADMHRGAAFSLEGLAERTVAYHTAALTVLYKADGSAAISGSRGERTARWTAQGNTVRLVYDQPVEWLYPAMAMPDGRNNPYPVRRTVTGLLIELVLDDNGAKFGETGSMVWTDGPDAGKPVALPYMATTNTASTLTTVAYADRRLPIAPAMTAIGATLYGAFNLGQPTADMGINEGRGFLAPTPAAIDGLEFISATQARFVFGKQLVDYRFEDNWLVLTPPSGPAWRFAIMVNLSPRASQSWLGEQVGATVRKAIAGTTIIGVPVKFTPETATRQYTRAGTGWYGQLAAGGSVSSSMRYPASSHIGNWEITSAGDLLVTYRSIANGAVAAAMHYVPLAVKNGRLELMVKEQSQTRNATYFSSLPWEEPF